MKIFQIIGGVTASLLVFNGVPAGAEPISKVRKAAIDKMQGRLGSIRGSIKPDTQNIFLTERMIENLRPIRFDAPAEVAVNSDTPDLDLPENTDPLDEKSSRQLAKEVYRSVGVNNVDRNLVTNSLDTSDPEKQ